MKPSARIGPYRVLHRIRSGGQGSVYLGYDPRLQRRVAIKLCPLPRERVARRRVLQEARLVASIESDRVVRLYDVISAPGHVALVMEYIPGVDLEELLQSGPLSLNAILSLAIDISAALACARQQRVVHADLKPSNVLVDRAGRAMLTDFGIARRGIDTGVMGPLAGSPSALSPEQYLGQPLDVRSDLFALGCLLYRLLAGKHPFMRGGALLPSLLLEADPDPLPACLADGTPLPPGLAGLVTRLLQKDPADRPDNTHRVRQILREEWRSQPQAMQQMPLAGVRSLQRRESEDDLPPVIPEALRGKARSQLAEWRGFAELTPRQILTYLRRPRVQAGVASLALVLGLLVYMALPTPARINLLPPEVSRVGATPLPAGVSLDWLAQRVCAGALAAGKALLFYDAPASCPSARAGLPGNRPLPPAREALGLVLRCHHSVCVLGLRREREGRMDYRQATLLADMSAAEWSAVVTDLAESLYAAPRPLRHTLPVVAKTEPAKRVQKLPGRMDWGAP